MIGFKTTIEFDEDIIPQKIDEARDRVLPLGADRIAERAKHSIQPVRQLLFSELSPALQRVYKKNKKPLPGVPSQPGQPPNTPTGILPGLIEAVANGPTYLIGATKPEGKRYAAGNALEFGRTYTLFGKQVTVQPRPFMGPAMTAVLPTLANDFKDSVKG